MVFHLRQILLDLAVAFDHLLLAELITVLFLLQEEQQVFLPVALQMSRDLLFAGLHPAVPIGRQFPRIAFTSENRLDNRLPGYDSDIALGIGQLQVHLGQGFLNALNVSARTPD